MYAASGFVSFSISTPSSRSTTFQMRWGSYISIWLVLVMMFIIPHDPSSSIENKHQIGSDAFKLARGSGGRVATSPQQSTSPRHATPVAVSSLSLLDAEHDTSVADEMLRLVRLARARPQRVLRLATTRLRTEFSSTTGLTLAASAEEEAEEAELLELMSTSITNNTLGWATTVEGLRESYGARQHWWGDLTPAETRALYHALLPTELASGTASQYSLAERAELAIAARRAARLYARERALLPYSIGCDLLDGVRQVRPRPTRACRATSPRAIPPQPPPPILNLLPPSSPIINPSSTPPPVPLRQMMSSGAFQKEGYSEEQIWLKYGGCLPSELPEGGAFHDDVYYTIINKACSTNKHVDKLCDRGLWSLATASIGDLADVVATQAQMGL